MHSRLHPINPSKYLTAHIYTYIHTPTHTRTIVTTTQDTDDTAPIDQPRRLSLRRPSFKREVIQNESFIDIQLKPVAKDKAQPQNAQQNEGSLTKVKRDRIYRWHTLWRLFYLSISLPLHSSSLFL